MMVLELWSEMSCVITSIPRTGPTEAQRPLVAESGPYFHSIFDDLNVRFPPETGH